MEYQRTDSDRNQKLEQLAHRKSPSFVARITFARIKLELVL